MVGQSWIVCNPFLLLFGFLPMNPNNGDQVNPKFNKMSTNMRKVCYLDLSYHDINLLDCLPILFSLQVTSRRGTTTGNEIKLLNFIIIFNHLTRLGECPSCHQGSFNGLS